jgi:hypothetical protein
MNRTLRISLTGFVFDWSGFFSESNAVEIILGVEFISEHSRTSPEEITDPTAFSGNYLRLSQRLKLGDSYSSKSLPPPLLKFGSCVLQIRVHFFYFFYPTPEVLSLPLVFCPALLHIFSIIVNKILI